MRSHFKWLAVSSAIFLGAQVLPALADDADDGAKGLFFTQLDKPAQQLNTGIQYWIELSRNGNISKVNNKTVFHSGDKIRFHVKPNIDGFAYILLRSGSRGEQQILFPDPQRNEENRMEHGKDYVLPNDGALKFDQNPGIEKLTLLLARSPIDTAAYLSPTSGGSSGPLVATIASGSKDLIPTEVVVSYVPPSPLPKQVTEAVEQVSNPTSPSKGIVKNESVKKPIAVRNHPKHATVSSNPVHKSQTLEAGITTVVYKDPTGVLAVDVSLEHQL
jgi:hypothetical protein